MAGNFIEYQGKYGARFIMVTKDNTKAKRKIYENLLTWEFFKFRTEGYFVEVGANDPKAGSQTWLLEQLVCSSAKGVYPCYNLGACKIIPQSLSWAIIP